MKRIAGLATAPPSHVAFHADVSIEKTWESLRDHPAYRELRDALADRQHGLCAYCETDLIPNDISIEHIVPRSDPEHGKHLACDHGNMLAVCRGGGNTAVFGPCVRHPDPRRVLPPIEKNLCCGQAKGDRPASDFLDPRHIPRSPAIVSVGEDGTIASVSDACREHGIDRGAVDAHLDRLRLHIERLRIRRETIWQELAMSFDLFLNLPATERDDHLTALAERQLLPNHENKLAPFFTTARSFFGPLAETILARPPQAWV
jgi:uncharacterized protein (TIGR02646 family)